MVFTHVFFLTATIGLLSSVQRQLSVVSAEAEGGTKEVDYSDIWTPRIFDDTKYWFLKTGKLFYDFAVFVPSAFSHGMYLFFSLYKRIIFSQT
jgi:hypothetical protein